MDKNRTTIGVRIKQLHKDGYSRKEIVKLLACSSATISRYLTRNPSNDKAHLVIKLRNQGLTFKEIKEQTSYSKSTISKWIQFAKPLEKQISTSNHQSNNPFIKSIKYTRQNKILVLKQWLLLLKTQCVNCGYKRCIQDLHFHHQDQATKKFHLSKSHLQSLSAIVREINKCIILCSRCHTEHHYGLITISHQNQFNLTLPDVPENVREAYSEKLVIEITDEVKQFEEAWLVNKIKTTNERKVEQTPAKKIEFDKLIIVNIEKEKADEILNSYHYFGSTNKGYIATYGLLFNDELIGVAIINNCVRQGQVDTCELSRFVLTVSCKNLASKFLSLIIKKLKQQTKYKTLQSFAQSDIHTGTIYKAAGFRYLHFTKNTYNYSGIHRKTIYERAIAIGLTEQEYAQLFKLIKTSEASKIKFAIDL